VIIQLESKGKTVNIKELHYVKHVSLNLKAISYTMLEGVLRVIKNEGMSGCQALFGVIMKIRMV